MIHDDLIRHHLDEHRREARDRAERSRLLAAARAGRPRGRRAAALRAMIGLRVAGLGLWLAGPTESPAPSGQRS